MGRRVWMVAIAMLGGCTSDTGSNEASESPRPASAETSRTEMLDALKRRLGGSNTRDIEADEPFRVWPRALASEVPFAWGVLATDLQMIDSPVGGGLGQRIELRTNGSFTVRMTPPADKYLFFRCSVEPSNLGSPSTPGLVRWEARFNNGMPAASGDFSRDPVSNYWTFATPNTTTGNAGYVKITSPMGPQPHWAIGFCDVLPFELPSP